MPFRTGGSHCCNYFVVWYRRERHDQGRIILLAQGYFAGILLLGRGQRSGPPQILDGVEVLFTMIFNGDIPPRHPDVQMLSPQPVRTPMLDGLSFRKRLPNRLEQFRFTHPALTESGNLAVFQSHCSRAIVPGKRRTDVPWGRIPAAWSFAQSSSLSHHFGEVVHQFAKDLSLTLPGSPANAEILFSAPLSTVSLVCIVVQWGESLAQNAFLKIPSFHSDSRARVSLGQTVVGGRVDSPDGHAHRPRPHLGRVPATHP